MSREDSTETMKRNRIELYGWIAAVGVFLIWMASAVAFTIWMRSNDIQQHPEVYAFYTEPIRFVVEQPMSVFAEPILTLITGSFGLMMIIWVAWGLLVLRERREKLREVHNDPE